jgi:hypothetical protein
MYKNVVAIFALGAGHENPDFRACKLYEQPPGVGPVMSQVVSMLISDNGIGM